MMVWIDCEMTGLDLAKDELIEVAVLVTDAELNVLGDGVDVVISPSQQALDNMGEFVTEMHRKSGLLEDLTTDKAVSMAEAEKICLDYIKQFVSEERKVPLAGNTIGTDRSFLAKDMPELEGFLHYRNIDVSSIKELAKRWYPVAYNHSPEKNGNHRALADIQESIEEMRYYREAIFVAAPGPSKQQASNIAKIHQGELTGITSDDV